MNYLQNLILTIIIFGPIVLLIYSHCRAVNVNMFNLIEVIDSIEKIRKEKRIKG